MELGVSSNRRVTPHVVKDVDSDERLWPIIRQLLKWSPSRENYCLHALRATMPPVKKLGSGKSTDTLCLTPQIEFLTAHEFDVEEILKQTKLNGMTGRLVSVWRTGVKEYMRDALERSAGTEFAQIRYFKYAKIKVTETKTGNSLGTLRRMQDKERCYYQLPLKTPYNLDELQTDRDALLMWHFSRLVTALELDLNLLTSTKEKLPLFSREKPTGCPAAVKEQAIVMAVVFVITAIYLQL